MHDVLCLHFKANNAAQCCDLNSRQSTKRCRCFLIRITAPEACINIVWRIFGVTLSDRFSGKIIVLCEFL